MNLTLNFYFLLGQVFFSCFFPSKGQLLGNIQTRISFFRGAFDSANNHKRQRRKRQSVTAKRKKSQTPKFV